MSKELLRPKQHLASLGLQPKHHFGQNFLADTGLAERIAELATPRGEVCVLEIGAGLGDLTAPLLERARRVIAIERDRDLLPALRQRFGHELGEARLELLEADAKTADWFAGFAEEDAVVIAGNLPYQITGPLLQRLCGVATRVERVVLLVQLEVAARLIAKPNTADYGALSVFVQAQYQATREFIIRRGAFYPQPRVDSAVVRLEPRRPPLAEETPLFAELVRHAFGQRRKQLRNAWKGLADAPLPLVEQAAERAGIDLAQRGECLSVEQFREMARHLEQPA